MSMALMLTITSNILGIFTMPFILPHIVAAAPLAAAGGGLVTARLDPLPLLLQLCNTILLPTLIGACIRGFVPGACGGRAHSPRPSQQLRHNSRLACDARCVMCTALQVPLLLLMRARS